MDRIIKIAHRGAKAYEPENTLISFQRALDLGAGAVELDVHVCKSGELVVLHDITVDRTTNGSGAVKDLTLAELKTFLIDGKYEIPTLIEVLDLINKKALVNIELKGANTAFAVSDCIEKYKIEKGWNYEDFIVSGFERTALENMSRINPKIPLGVLTETDIEEALEWAVAFSAKAIHPDFKLLKEEEVVKIQRLGYKVFPWTVNAIQDIERMKRYGVDGIISDYPDRI